MHTVSRGKHCARYRPPNGWGLREFEHFNETGLVLSGAHGKLACEACHPRPPAGMKLAHEYFPRHGKDDMHVGWYGQHRCRFTMTWKGAQVRSA